MKSFKKIIFRYFEKIEQNKQNKNVDSNGKVDLSQPVKNNAKDKERNKKILKKSLWVLIFLSVIGLIIGLSVYFSTRPTSIKISSDNSLNITVDNQQKNIIKINNKYSVNLDSSNVLLAAYYNGSSSNFICELQTLDSSLPLSIQIGSVGPDTIQWGTYRIVPESSSSSQNQGSYSKTIANNKLFEILSAARSSAVLPDPGFNWMALISVLMPLLTLGLLIFFYSKMIKKQMGGMLDGSLFGSKSDLKNVKTNVKFSDVAGIAEVKEELSEVVDYIKRPEKYAQMGARSPRGVILYGPPGTGKTLIAKAVAGESNCNFYAASGSSFEDMLVGVGAKRVKELFATARKNSPSIIFIDEIDSVAAKRGKNDIIGGGGGVADQTINQLLAEMDGFNTADGVVVIAATNRLDSLDDAILRPGRFDRQIQVNLPDISEREEILKIHSKNKNLSAKVNLLDIARRTPGFSGAQLENVLNEATLLAVRENKIAISMENLDEAIDRTIGGPKRKIRVMSEHEKKQISYHEAGHALVGLHCPDADIVQKITIIPRGNAAGYTLQTPKEQEKQIMTKTNLLDIVRMTLGGRAAEEVIYGKNNISSGASNDLYKVTNIVRSMVTQLGMTDLGLTQFIPSEGQQPFQKQYSEDTAQLIDKKIEEIIYEQYNQAKKIIEENKYELDLIVETLLLLETILKDQIDYIHKHLQLPKEAIEAKKRLEESYKKEDEQNEETNSNENEKL